MCFSNKVFFFVMTGLAGIVLFAAPSSGNAEDGGLTPARTNIALGKKYTFNKTTQTTAFRPTQGSAPAAQLTDGKYGDSATAGWFRQAVVSVTIDLGQIEPITGISYSSAISVAWPVAISLFTSDNGKEFYYVGDVIRLSVKRGVPGIAQSTHRYIAEGLATKGRYVRLVIRAGQGANTRCDEIEVYRGSEQQLAHERAGKPLTEMQDMEAFSVGMVTDAGARIRLRQDLAAMRRRVEASELSPGVKSSALRQLTALAPQIDSLPRIEAQGFRAVVPMNDLHARIMQVNASMLRAQGLPAVCIWKKNRWDRLGACEGPPDLSKTRPTIDVAMMNKEYRSAAFNITNAGNDPLTAVVRIEGLPGGVNPDYVRVHQVEFVDTIKKVFVADALPLAVKTSEGFAISVPAGMTRQVWLTFHPTDLVPQKHSGVIRVQLEGESGEMQLPLTLHVFDLTFPEQPTLSLFMFEFSNNPLGEFFPPAIIGDLRAHFVDVAVGNNDVVPGVKPSDLDDEGNLLATPDFSRFDNWIKLWQGKGIQEYIVSFHGSRKDFAGKSLGTPAFQRAVRQWAKAWGDHNRTLGLEPGQVAVSIFDEPQKAEDAQRIVHWAKAIKAGTSEIHIWVDPVHTVKWYDEAAEAFEICDILCPNLATYVDGLPRSGNIFGALQAKGKKLWFYQASGPVRLMDPYYYNRLSSWYCFKYGATGNGFWSYVDTGWAKSAWNMYRASYAGFTPAYLSETDVTSGKHWEAVREGIEDFEYLCMLRDRIAQLQAKPAAVTALAKAKQVLRDSLDQVIPEPFDQTNGAYKWDGLIHGGLSRAVIEGQLFGSGLAPGKDRSLADQARQRILTMLEQLPHD